MRDTPYKPYRTRRAMRVVALLAFVLALLGGSLHHHDRGSVETARCAVCLAVHHSPAVASPTAGAMAPAPLVLRHALVIVAAADPLQGPPAKGRGPPHPAPAGI
jgi:hypothetical protein